MKENPIKIFEQWLKKAKLSELNDYNAMTLSTVNEYNIPSSRMVLLKYFSDSGFYFFTNKNSNKAKDIEYNNNVSLLFHWKSLRRQIRINGIAIPTSTKQNQEYFKTRAIISQIGAIVSKQSKILTNKQLLIDKVEQYLQTIDNPKNIKCPEYWGGFFVVPSSIELWTDGENRLHDRFIYNKQSDNSWTKKRLYP